MANHDSHVKFVRKTTAAIHSSTDPEQREALSEKLADHWRTYNRNKRQREEG